MNAPFLRSATSGSAAVNPRRRRSSKGLRQKPVLLQVQSLEPRLALAVADRIAPAVRSITPPDARTYAAGSVLSFRVNFTENVVVTGSPTLPVTIGGTVRQAAWNGRGSGSNALVFTTSVQSGDAAPTGVRIAGPIGFAGGAAIRDRAGNALIAATSGTFPRVVVDAVGPSVTRFGAIAVTPRRVSLAVTFTEPVSVAGRPSIPFTLAGAQKQLVYASGSGSNVLTFAYTPSAREVPTVSNVLLPTQAIGLNGAMISDRFGNRVTSLAKPTDITLSSATVAENQPSGTIVGDLSVTDPDARDRFTYSLVSGDGSTDNTNFQIVGEQLRIAGPFDFETKANYTVRVRSTDSGGLSIEKAFTITVTNGSDTPTDIALSKASIAENCDANTVVGTLATTDPDAGSTFTYTLVSGTGSSDNAAFNISGNQLRATDSLDHDTKSSWSVRVRSTDQSGLYTEKVFAIMVTNLNEEPTDIAISASTIAENSGVNAVVGTLSTSDPDAGNTFTYSLVTGTGSADNASFNIAGNQLRATDRFDFETRSSYAVRVRATDQDGLFADKAFTITVTDVDDVVIQLVKVGDGGNVADTNPGGFGAVDYEYRIGAYEITIGQYTKFLNAVASTDTYGLYNLLMGQDLNIAGISRLGSRGSYSYSVMANGGDSANRPITYVSWYNAARFANWMHNGQPTGRQDRTTTEDGAYTLGGPVGSIPLKNAGARFYIPTEHEWYKAAYYKGGSTNAGYWNYATQSDDLPGNTIGDGTNQANHGLGGYAVTQSSTFSETQNYLTDVGAFSSSASYYGTFDQSGNALEWYGIDGVTGYLSGLRGGFFGYNPDNVSSSWRMNYHPSDSALRYIGFRLASPVAVP